MGDEKTARGQTPFDLKLEKADQPVKIALRKDGFKEETRDVLPVMAEHRIAVAIRRHRGEEVAGAG